MSCDTVLKRQSNAVEQIGTGMGIMRQSVGKHDKVQKSAKKCKKVKKRKNVKKHKNVKRHENVQLQSHTHAMRISGLYHGHAESR